MINKGSLTNLTIIYIIGNLLSKLLSFLVVFYVTYFLSKDALGKYDIIQNSLSFIAPVVSLQIGASVLRWLLKDPSEDGRAKILQNAYSFLGISLMLYTLIHWSIYFFTSFRFSGLIYVIVILQVSFSVLQQALRGLSKNTLFVYSGILTSLLFVVFSFINLYFFKMEIDGLLLAQIIAIFITLPFFFFLGRIYRYLSFSWSFSQLRDLLSYSLPLLPNNINWWLITSANRYIILYYLGSDANGIFAVSYRFPSIIMLIADVFYLAWQEKAILADGADNLTANSEILNKYIKLLFSIIIILSSLSKPVMKYLVDEPFHESWAYVPLLLYAVMIQALAGFYGAAYLGSIRTKEALWSTFWGALTTLLLAIVLTKFAGLYGVSISILIGFAVVLLIRTNTTKSFFPLIFPVKLLTALTVVFILVSCVNYLNIDLLSGIGLLVSSLIFVYLNVDYLNVFKEVIVDKRKLRNM